MAFDYATNFSGGQALNTTGSLLTYGNYVTNGYMGYGLLFFIWIMVFLGGQVTNFRKSGVAAFFVTTIFSVYFMRIGMVSIPTVITLVVFTVVTAIAASREGSSAL